MATLMMWIVLLVVTLLGFATMIFHPSWLQVPVEVFLVYCGINTGVMVLLFLSLIRWQGKHPSIWIRMAVFLAVGVADWLILRLAPLPLGDFVFPFIFLHFGAFAFGSVYFWLKLIRKKKLTEI